MIQIWISVATNSKKPRLIKTIVGYKFFLQAAPIEGKANQELIARLSMILHIAPSKLTIIKGLTSKNKLISINQEYTKIEIENLLEMALEKK